MEIPWAHQGFTKDHWVRADLLFPGNPFSLWLSDPWPHPAPGEKHSLHPIQLWTFCGWLFLLQPRLWVWLGKGFVVLRSLLHGPSTKKMPFEYRFCLSLALLFSCSVTFDSSQLYGLQCARPPCPSLSPGVCSDSCPLSR